MKSELLLQIKDAEATAAKLAADASAQAQQLIADARREAEANQSEGREQADHAYMAMLEGAKTSSDAEAATILAAGEAEANELRDGFQTKVQGVTKRVLGLFEESL